MLLNPYRFGVAVPPFVYALEDNGTLAATYGGGYLPTDAPAHLVGRRTLDTATVDCWALPSSFTEAVLVTGQILAYEILIQTAPWDAGMGGSYLIGGGIAITNGGGTLLGSTRITFQVSAGNTLLKFEPSGGGFTLDTFAADTAEGARIGVYFNTTTGQIGVRTASTDYGYQVATLSGAGFAVPWLDVADSTSLTVISGQEAVVELITSSAGMTMTYPVGAVSILGEVL